MDDNLLIKSADRTAGSSSNFKVESTHIIEGEYMLKHAIIPSTIYNVNQSNNTFVLNEGGAESVIPIPIGNYTQDTFT